MDETLLTPNNAFESDRGPARPAAQLGRYIAAVETLAFSKSFLPFERMVLAATWELLNPNGRALFAGQIRRINRIQRLLDWREVEFYCMRWFKVRWPIDVLFSEKDELVLATVLLRNGESRMKVTVWSVGGHVFSLESPNPMKPLRKLTNLTIDNAYAGHHQYKAAI